MPCRSVSEGRAAEVFSVFVRTAAPRSALAERGWSAGVFSALPTTIDFVNGLLRKCLHCCAYALSLRFPAALRRRDPHGAIFPHERRYRSRHNPAACTSARMGSRVRLGCNPRSRAHHRQGTPLENRSCSAGGHKFWTERERRAKTRLSSSSLLKLGPQPGFRLEASCATSSPWPHVRFCCPVA